MILVVDKMCCVRPLTVLNMMLTDNHLFGNSVLSANTLPTLSFTQNDIHKTLNTN
jgi:hypothetical protein